MCTYCTETRHKSKPKCKARLAYVVQCTQDTKLDYDVINLDYDIINGICVSHQLLGDHEINIWKTLITYLREAYKTCTIFMT